MMSILFKGVEMPKGCWDCPFQTNPICVTNDILNFTTRIARPDNCPLIEVPEDVQPMKHGRWIDGDYRCVTAVCSKCKHLRLGNGAKFATRIALYCEHCGARMDGET